MEFAEAPVTDVLFWVAPSCTTGFEFAPVSTPLLASNTLCEIPDESAAILAEQIGQVSGLCAVIASATPCAKFTSISASF